MTTVSQNIAAAHRRGDHNGHRPRGGFELYRTLNADVAANTALTPISAPTLVLAAHGQGAAIAATVAPRARSIVRVADVPDAGHWLVEENPVFVADELITFLAG